MSPTDTLNTTPYEIWENKKRKLQNLQLFGSDCYAKEHGSLEKLDKRSTNFKFVGYAPISYRLRDKERRIIIIARDVRFKENYEEEISKEERKRQ